MTDQLKVSVVVAAYRSGPGLDRLVASLDSQTLPTAEWEVIFVDDGSPDDTYDRLLAVQSTRPHVRLERIENSGWPCRPRNVGTDLAQGEYVAYMDHDDELYPDALRAGYEFAKRFDADVVNGKEARTHDSGWAIDQYRADSGQVVGRTDFHPLIPTNPHKLYRRALLQDNGIRFREGGRVLWEDIFFNVLVARHAKVVSTMASTPYYHWFATPGSGSSTFVRSSPEWWYWLDQVVTAIDEDLAGEEFDIQRRLLRIHQYRSRLIDAFNNLYATRPAAERKLIFEKAHQLQASRFPETDDEHLNRTLRMRAQLLRRGYRHLLERLTVDDPNIPGTAEVTSARWKCGILHLETSAKWQDSTGRRHRLVERAGRFVKDLPDAYRTEFAPDLLDVTDDLRGATVEIGMRSRSSRITWMAPSTSELQTATTPDGHVEWGLVGAATVDPAAAAMGNPLERGVWELSGRCTLAGTVQHRIVRGRDIRPAIDLDGEGVAAVYSRPDGVIVLDFDQTATPLTHLIRFDGEVSSTAGITSIRVAGIPADEDHEIPTHLDVNTETLSQRLRRAPRRIVDRVRRRDPGPRGWRTVPATLRIEGGRATLETRLPSQEPALVRIGERIPGASSVLRLSTGHSQARRYRGSLRALLS